MHVGESLTPMSEDRLKEIFNETQTDFSRTICPGATEQNLDPAAVGDCRRRWFQKSQNQALANLPARQLLSDAGLMRGDDVTYAALVLLGTREALTQLLPNAEIVFEYRSSEASIPSQQRENLRQGFDKMFSGCLRQTRPLPDFVGTDPYQVSIKLNGTVQDPAFNRRSRIPCPLARAAHQKLALPAKQVRMPIPRDNLAASFLQSLNCTTPHPSHSGDVAVNGFGA
jgi:hypothetical protein